MSTKTSRKFCKISQWIEKKDSAFMTMLNEICMTNILLGSRGGTTFIYPSDEVRKSIIAKANSGRDADYDEVYKQIKAHVLYGVMVDPADFKSTGSHLDIQLGVDRTGPDTVTLTNGAEIKRSDFKVINKDRNRLAVWIVTKGTMPLEGTKYTRVAPSRRDAVRGGNETAARPQTDTRSVRCRIGLALVDDYDKCMQTDRCASREPYLEASVSLLNFLRYNHPSLLAAVLPVIDRDPFITFHLLVEPSATTQATMLLPDDVVAGWNNRPIFNSAVSEYKQYFDNETTDASAPAIYNNPDAVRVAIDNIRDTLMHNLNRGTAQMVADAYATLMRNNTIGSVKNVLPPDAVQRLSFHKKMWQDEFRCIMHAAMHEVRSAPAYDRHAFFGLINTIATSYSGHAYEQELYITNPKSYMPQANANPEAEFMLLTRFINSSDFLYFPLSEPRAAEWGRIPTVVGTANFRNAEDFNVFNAEPAKIGYFNALEASGVNAPRTSLDIGTITQIKHYMERHNGQLPSELAPQ